MYNSGAMPDLRQCLLDTYLVRLRAIARFWGIELTARRQRAVAIELSEAMSDPTVVSLAWDALPPDQRDALLAVLASDGHMPRRIFVREWGEIRSMGPGRMEREEPWRAPISPAEGLWYTGFIFSAFEQVEDAAYEAVFVPPELRNLLPAPSIDQSMANLESTNEAAVVVYQGAYLLDDFCTLLSYVQNERPQLRVDGGWPERHRERMSDRLRVHQTEYFAFLAHLARRIGWIVVDSNRQVRLKADAVQDWLQCSPLDQLSAVLAAWGDDPTWNDLFHVPSLQPEDTGAWKNDPVLSRTGVLRHLEECRPGAWYRLADFVGSIKRKNADFQRPDGDYHSWYIQDMETGDYLSGFETWDAVEGRLIRYLIRGPLAWIGVIALGSQDGEQSPTVFRLSREGAGALGMADPPQTREPRRARLVAGFRVALPAERRYDRFQLSRVADWLQSGPVYVYRLTPTSLARARQQGITVTRVLEFLGGLTNVPVARSVEAALTRWAARGVEARLERTAILRVFGEGLMDQVVRSRKLGGLILERVGPSAATVREQDWERIIGALEELGLLAEVDEHH
ncbi:MAG: helicase-associated domain-containing protein [Anaerolineae bacterium]